MEIFSVSKKTVKHLLIKDFKVNSFMNSYQQDVNLVHLGCFFAGYWA